MQFKGAQTVIGAQQASETANDESDGNISRRGVGTVATKPSSYMYERAECSEILWIRTSDLKVGEQKAQTHNRRVHQQTVDQALTSLRLLWQTEARKDPYAARVHASPVHTRGRKVLATAAVSLGSAIRCGGFC